MCLTVLSPPFRHAASTIYFCLKCDLYDCVCGLLLIRGLLGPDSSDDVVRSGALFDGQDMIESSARFEERVGNPYGPRAALGSERGSIVSESASEGRLYACFSQSSFQVKSSASNSCHRLDTCEDLARVLGSSTKERTYEEQRGVSTEPGTTPGANTIPASRARWVDEQRDPS
jgi:hypothetical protein